MRSVFRPWSVAAAGLLLVAGCGKGGTKVVVPPLSAIVLNVVTDTLAVNAPKQYSATALDLSSQPVSGATPTPTTTTSHPILRSSVSTSSSTRPLPRALSSIAEVRTSTPSLR